MQIKLKIRRFERSKSLVQREKNRFESLSPEKRRKLEEMTLARRDKGGQISWPEKPVRVPHKKIRTFLSKKDWVCQKIIEWGIIGLLVFSPLPAASVYEWSILVIELTVFVMFGAYILWNNKPALQPMLSSSLKWPRYLFIAFFLLIIIQMIPVPSFFMKHLSPNTYSLRALYSPHFASAKFLGISLIPAHSFQKGLELLAYFLLGYLVLKTVVSRRHILRILYVLMGMGVFQALYGFFELYNKNPRILLYKKMEHLDCVTGTFMNRNHLSGYLEMVVPIAIGVILARADFFSFSGLSWKEKVLRFTDERIFTRIFVPASIIVMALAIIFSKSRSGIFLLIFAFILIFEFSVLYFRRLFLRKKVISRFLKLIFLVITFLALFIGIDNIMNRFSMENLLHERRPIFWSQTVRIIKDFPLFGSGLGTFESMYPAYAKMSAPAQLVHAHNDYLEYFSECGILGVTFLLIGVLYLLVKMFVVWRDRDHPFIRGLGLGGLVAIILLLLHSLTDFNLHIPANLILFSVILSLTAATVFYNLKDLNVSSTVRPSEKGQSDEFEIKGKRYTQEMREWQKSLDYRTKSPLKKTGMIVSVAILVLVSGAIYWSDFSYIRAKKIDSQVKKIKILKGANAIYPVNDLVHLEMGKADYALGLEPSEFNEVKIAHLNKAVLQCESSLEINPLSGFGHFYLGKSLEYLSSLVSGNQDEAQNTPGLSPRRSMSQELDTRANEEYKKAIQLAGSHGEIYLNVGEKNFMRWNDLSAEDKQFTVDFLKELAERMDKEEFLELMDYWKNYVQDYSVMASILPDELRYYRMYANFLGEKSLSSHERHWAMAKAEAMRLSLAIEELKAGENAFMYRLIKKASAHFEACQEILERLKFYQNLTGDKFIEPEEYRTVQKKVSLRIAKCRLLEGQGLRDVQSYLLRYLDLEDDEMSVDELAAFLRKRGLIGEQLKSDLDDWNRLAFHMNLALKQGQIAEVVKVGRILESNRPSFPTKNVESFTKVMHMVGNALLRTGFFTDACTFYNRALETDPNNLDVLIALRESYERAGDEINSRKTWDRIEKMLSPRVQDYDDFRIQKGMNFSRTLKLDGEKLVLKLTFGTEDQNIKPLVSVWLDDRVIWENYLEGTVLSIPLEPRAGENTLTVVPINTDVVLKSIGYEVGIR